MLKLYYSPGACSLAPHIVLEEIGQPYELARVPLAEGAHLKADYLAINPKARVPALEGPFGQNGASAGILTEAPAILLYLAQLRPELELLPPDPNLQARSFEWLNWLSSSMHAMSFAQIWRPHRFVAETTLFPAVSTKGRENVTEQYAYIEALMNDGRGWAVAGAGFTVADAFLFVFYRWGMRIGLDMKAAYPSWTRIAERTLARPSVQRAMAGEGITISS
ncbi:glutathione S-transferase family protein [Microvirga sp. TS319]|uniref:glutathione S-transferase family protein n=1 Tax=Microvirga sp. TS319 TaxID=3241165 RepID=UPI00351A6308